jgi:hypothetical protein
MLQTLESPFSVGKKNYKGDEQEQPILRLAQWGIHE